MLLSFPSSEYKIENSQHESVQSRISPAGLFLVKIRASLAWDDGNTTSQGHKSDVPRDRTYGVSAEVTWSDGDSFCLVFFFLSL